MSDLTAALKTMCLPYIVVAAARLLVRAAVAETLTSQQQLLAVTSRIRATHQHGIMHCNESHTVNDATQRSGISKGVVTYSLGNFRSSRHRERCCVKDIYSAEYRRSGDTY